MKKKITISGRIVCAYADAPNGPGWSNQLIWVISRRDDGSLIETALQPDEQTPEMVTLFRICQAAHDALCRAVETATQPERG